MLDLQEPRPGYWYINRTGKLMKVKMVMHGLQGIEDGLSRFRGHQHTYRAAAIFGHSPDPVIQCTVLFSNTFDGIEVAAIGDDFDDFHGRRPGVAAATEATADRKACLVESLPWLGTKDLLQDDGQRAESGEAGLQQVGAHKYGQPHPVRMDVMGQGNTGQDNGTGKGHNNAINTHGVFLINILFIIDNYRCDAWLSTSMSSKHAITQRFVPISAILCRLLAGVRRPVCLRRHVMQSLARRAGLDRQEFTENQGAIRDRSES